MGPDKSAGHMFFGMHISDGLGSGYAMETYLDANRQIKYRWIICPRPLPIPVKPFVKRDRVFLGPDIFTVEPELITAYPYNQVINNFTSITVSTDNGIPAEGVLRIYLYLPDSTKTLAGSCFREIKLFITDENDQEHPTSAEYLLINDLSNNFVPDDVELPNGDLPDLLSKLTIYDGGFMTFWGATTLWTLDGFATAYTYAEIIARMIAAEMRTTRQSYQVSLADAVPSVSLCFVDTTNSNVKLIEAGISYNDRMQTIEGRYIELPAIDIDDFTVAVIQDYKGSTKTGSTSAGKGGVIYSTDEKVRLIDPVTFDIEGNAGFMNSSQFNQVLDEDTGRTVNSIMYFNHVEAKVIKNLSSRAVSVTFNAPFEALPAGVGSLKVYRLQAQGAGSVTQNVLHTVPGANWLTTDGFALNIDPRENLTGVIVDYCFTENL
jgi:hypothetical protein